ncbi:sensor histidine kinase [Paenibacillus protaetiae]|uniref:histidine kinase n=1 Tax=Paenibacillus protaetiae TaxID=2509456 RepID=A0A4P6F5J9_9BACL|nr:HAMP domain-containing sensor histidine kinase [Paenibacillus protaetiae]QAY65678.1 HAMP domain-containing histidine kinase [Paenibacillus protaetiae]
MTIRRKLYLSYIAMVFVPMFAIVVFSLAFLYVSGQTDFRAYWRGEKNLPYRQAFTIGELNEALQHRPDTLEKPDEWTEMFAKLGEVSAGVIVMRGGQVIQVSPYLKQLGPHHDWARLAEERPEYVNLRLYRFKTESLPFHYSDGTAGQAVIVWRYDSVPFFWHPIFGMAVCILIGLTMALMTYMMSRSIIRPIQSLNRSALLMKEGDLTRRIDTRAKGEIGELGKTLEEMRVRLKASIDQTLQYEENRKMLLSNISHDLKTPISAIRGYVEGISDGIANTEEMRGRYMETIKRKAADMDKLIDELFLYSKLDLHALPFDWKTVDLMRYLIHLAEESRFDLEASGISLHVEQLADRKEPLYVTADPQYLSRVFSNIFDNSVKYMTARPSAEANPEIRVSVYDHGTQALIIIQDNGPGIEEEALPHIFDRFYRAEKSRNSDLGGSGLGLAIVKQIVEGLGGSVWAENGVDGGARFCISLPAASGKDGDSH